MSDDPGTMQTLSRGDAERLLREIKRSAGRVAASNHRDLANRAAEIEAIAHFLLYDFDGGREVE